MPQQKRKTSATGRASRTAQFPIVGIGASAGGLEALSELLSNLPRGPGMAFVVVSHMQSGHPSMLAALLAKKCKMPVRQAARGTVIQPNHIYVIQPGKYLTLKNGVLHTTARENGDRLPTVIDHFLGSLALDRRASARGVVLSGVGSDGTEGLTRIHELGGHTFVQEPHTAQFDGMPASAIHAGCVDFVLSPRKIAAQLVNDGRPLRTAAPRENSTVKPRDYLDDILSALFQSSGVDFSHYKLSTLRRRIARRMQLHHLGSLAAYASYLRQHPEETKALHKESLIHVSSFFRDPLAFRALERQVLAPLAKASPAAESIRVWVPGCARGQEVYSIGILLLEQLEETNWPRIQIFGTDISTPDIEAARIGRYSATDLAAVSPARRRRFFVAAGDDYRVRQDLRQICVFAAHDVGGDPPYSKLDLISCRNLLIYFARPLQDRVIETFHFALKPDGHLFLGRSESLLGRTDLFALCNKTHHIYSRKLMHVRPNLHVMRPGQTQRRSAALESTRAVARVSPPPPGEAAKTALQQQIDRALIERYAPPGIFVDEELKIISFQGDVSQYLRPSSGQADLHLGKMLPADIVLDIRTAMTASRRNRRATLSEGLSVSAEGQSRPYKLIVMPVGREEGAFPGYLVMFEPLAHPTETNRNPKPLGPGEQSELVRVKKLLTSTREQFHAVIEEQEKSVQDLTTAREELLSGHEELQSSNEELETAKEELQSDNEELTTVNEELRKRTEELDRLTSELSNLIAGVNIPIVNLDHEHTVLRFSFAAKSAFNLIDADIGRSFDHIKVPLSVKNLDELITQALTQGTVIEREVQDKAGRWQLLRIRPYRRTNNWIEGAFIALIDIDTTKRRAAAIVETIHELLLVLDAQTRVVMVNPAFCRTFDISATDAQGASLFRLAHGEWDIPELRRLIKVVLPRQRHFEGFRIEHKFASAGRKVFLLSGHRMFDELSASHTSLILFQDVTDREAAANELRALTHRLHEERELADRHLAHELHDLSSQGFAGLNLDLAQLARVASAAPGEVERGLRALGDRVSALAQGMHELARRLHPSVLDDLGLTRALKAECHAFQERTSTPVICRIASLRRKLPEAVALCLYRIAQEVLRNIDGHAKATRVTVTLTGTQKQVRLIIQDNGVGFDPAAARAKGRLGLVSITERAASVGGAISVSSKRGAGTTVRVTVPVR